MLVRQRPLILTLWRWSHWIPRKLDQYNYCWWPGFVCCQDIISNGIDCFGSWFINPLWRRISITYAISGLRNYQKFNYTFIVLRVISVVLRFRLTPSRYHDDIETHSVWLAFYEVNQPMTLCCESTVHWGIPFIHSSNVEFIVNFNKLPMWFAMPWHPYHIIAMLKNTTEDDFIISFLNGDIWISF